MKLFKFILGLVQYGTCHGSCMSREGEPFALRRRLEQCFDGQIVF